MTQTAQLVVVTLETNHLNTNGSAWYAYFTGEPTAEQLAKAGTDRDDRDEASRKAFCCNKEGPYDEVPNKLSHHAGLRRYYAGWAD